MSRLLLFLIRFVLSHSYLILQLSLSLFLLAILLISAHRRREKKDRELLIMRERESRRLTERISNPAYLEREGIEFSRSYPYKVHDGSVRPAEQDGLRDRVISVSLQTKMLTREFLVPVSDGIRIGRGPNNTISIEDPDVAEHQCLIFYSDGRLCVGSQSTEPIELRRGNRSIQVNDRTIALNGGDMICFGDNCLILEF